MDAKVREKAIVKTSIIGIIGNVLLVGFKAFVGFIANSVSIISDALNNFTDALSSIITLIGAKVSNKKPDKKHPFGHGRFEYIASILVALLILVAGGIAIYQSILSIIDYFKNGVMPDYSLYQLIIIGGAIVIKLSIAIFYRIRGKKFDSDALKASGMDALFDVILSTTTLVGAIVAFAFNFYIEGYLGIIIGGFIIKTGIEVLVQSISSVLGKRMDKEKVNAIMADLTSIPGVIGAYDLIIHSYGHDRFIGSVHVGVTDTLTAKEIQQIERQITYVMLEKYNIIMTVGIYAENNNNEIAKEIKQYLVSLIQSYPSVLQLHGFYYEESQNLINFDLVISFEDKEPQKTVDEIRNLLIKKYPDIKFIVQIDNDYSLS
jgi:cation diffusion facilitator family transporter